MKTRWLDRRIALPGPYLCLVLSPAEHAAAMKHCRVKNAGEWLAPHADATTHMLEHETYGLTAVVALGPYAHRTGVEIAGLLVHEAVHIWQHYARRMGEHSPGDEQEAYAVQAIAQELMAEFARRRGRRGRE